MDSTCGDGFAAVGLGCVAGGGDRAFAGRVAVVSVDVVVSQLLGWLLGWITGCACMDTLA